MGEKLIIAGPCSVADESDVIDTVHQATEHGVQSVRLNLWKPRTQAGTFEGAGEKGLPWLGIAAEAGLRVALEVMMPEHAEMVMKEVLLQVPHATLLLWIGSRNQNHLVQRDIARAVAGEERVKLMLKNQPWRSKEHWSGMVSHVLQGA